DMPQPIPPRQGLLASDVTDPRFDADGVHDIHRMIRKILDEYPARIAVDEAELGEAYRAVLWDYLQMAANSLVNSLT
ncbi:MAG: alpha-amylase, partial [Actinobacteria bacterium]|nr:alpha-amylase [Actinomycetota bacterium]